MIKKILIGGLVIYLLTGCQQRTGLPSDVSGQLEPINNGMILDEKK
ncbi:hypothetical protein [Arsenophonus nasoniae]|uniref:Lipoprotein n=1 Tax=Arsenophonus nasoniae TaxID=638 RepID=A0ABY8NXA3_9GAMM|nr:hypothetical protein [Arsenophonus nasoniae]WGM09010.1 hypothetical protein QE258_27260 [Arsenophonus nasoniae]